jgi:hypothetical protein
MLGGKKWAALAMAIALLAALQYVILETPTDLIPQAAGDHLRAKSPQGAYNLSRTRRNNRPAITLTLYGDAAIGPFSVLLVPVVNINPDPVVAPQQSAILRHRPRRSIVLIPSVPPGTYKLVIPGFRPFGLFAAQ